MTIPPLTGKPRLRFAPSPNGYMHLGHAYAALFCFEAARAMKGQFLIRIEDIDIQRCNAHYSEAFIEDLAWLGIVSDEEIVYQSHRSLYYEDALEKLNQLGILYPSILSRKENSAIAFQKESQSDNQILRDPDGALLYQGDEFNLLPPEQNQLKNHPEGYALRLHMERALNQIGERSFERQGENLSWYEIGIGPQQETGIVRAYPEEWGHVVLKRRDLETSYHLSVVIDDALQGITHVIRGQDLFYATSVHILVQKLLSLPTPIYCHHPLLRDENGRKLSKSDHDIAIRTLREQGWSVDDIKKEIQLPDFEIFR